MIKKLHHVAIAVRSLEGALPFYRDALGLSLRREAAVEDQGVKAALFAVGGCEIELVEPIDPEGGVARFLERRGEGIHHICLQTDDVRAELAGLHQRGVELIDQEPRFGLAGLISFIHPRAHRGVLVELAEPVGQGAGRDSAVDSGGRQTAPVRRLDHVAVAVRELEEGAQAWESSLGLKADGVLKPAGAKVRLARLPVGNAFLELVQPLSPDHDLVAFMDETGGGMFSLSVEVDDLEAMVAGLRNRGVQVSDPEPGVWEGTRLARIDRDSANGVAIEVVSRRG